MGLLLDTNILIWLYDDDPRLSRTVLDRLVSGADELAISVVSAWEYGQKRLKHPGELKVAFDEIAASVPHARLDLEYAVHTYAEALPLHHADPFDRMLIAQALHHGLTLVASDAQIHRYDIPILW